MHRDVSAYIALRWNGTNERQRAHYGNMQQRAALIFPSRDVRAIALVGEGDIERRAGLARRLGVNVDDDLVAFA
jgi:hypothetical protein